jgi:hypothetical protein
MSLAMRKMMGIGCGLCLLGLCGCASFKESMKGFAGVSTKALEEERKNAVEKSFALDYFSSYTKVTDILKEIGAYIYEQDVKKHMIAIYVSEQDTTPVGLFFTEVEKDKTKIEVSSSSTNAKENISKKVFKALDDFLKPKKQ